MESSNSSTSSLFVRRLPWIRSHGSDRPRHVIHSPPREMIGRPTARVWHRPLDSSHTMHVTDTTTTPTLTTPTSHHEDDTYAVKEEPRDHKRAFQRHPGVGYSGLVAPREQELQRYHVQEEYGQSDERCVTREEMETLRGRPRTFAQSGHWSKLRQSTPTTATMEFRHVDSTSRPVSVVLPSLDRLPARFLERSSMDNTTIPPLRMLQLRGGCGPAPAPAPAPISLRRSFVPHVEPEPVSSPDNDTTATRSLAVWSPQVPSEDLSNSEYSPRSSGFVSCSSAVEQPKKKKRKVRVCTTAGCDKLVVDRGVCIRHGGGKRCNVDGCECRAQNRGLCWKHGGFTICTMDGCGKRAKSRGMCWSHGGGTQCKHECCTKIAVSRGRCWAHGGGKRCKIPDCQKPAALRMDDYCTEHHGQFGSRGVRSSAVRGLPQRQSQQHQHWTNAHEQIR